METRLGIVAWGCSDNRGLFQALGEALSGTKRLRDRERGARRAQFDMIGIENSEL